MHDTEIAALIAKERERQQSSINLIASENYISDAVAQALCSEFGNKYAEGYPGKRYYAGNAVIDELELLTQHRAREAFGLQESQWSVNVQALSGSPANLMIYNALLPKDALLFGLALDHGGHLSHGHHVSATGTWWHSKTFHVDPTTEQLNYDTIREQALLLRPAMIVAGFTAYSRSINWAAFRSIADECGALLHVDMSHIAGLVAGGVYESPFAYADTVMTTTHKTLRGPRGALIFSKKDARELPKKINSAVFPGMQGGAHYNTIAGIAVALKESTTPAFATYSRTVIENTATLANALQSQGWHIVSGGTDTHLFLLRTIDYGIGGQEASDRLEREGIIVNKNSIPFDTRSPHDPSGIRIGCAAETTKGSTPAMMHDLAKRITSILRA